MFSTTEQDVLELIEREREREREKILFYNIVI
jgi:hypothetical protein